MICMDNVIRWACTSLSIHAQKRLTDRFYAVQPDHDVTLVGIRVDQFGIGIVTQGVQRSRSGRGYVQAEAGDVIMVNPGEIHDGTPLGSGARAFVRQFGVTPGRYVAALAAGGASRTNHSLD